MAGLFRPFAEKLNRFGDLGLGLKVICAERTGQSFGAGNGVGDLAVIEVGGKSQETGFGQPRAECFDGIV